MTRPLTRSVLACCSVAVVGDETQVTAPARTGRGRHAASRAPSRSAGPVTAALKLAGSEHPRPLAVALRAWPVSYAMVLARPALAGSPRLGDYAGQVLGLDATLCLVATLAITPVLTAVRLPQLAKLRWYYGVSMFALGFLGLALALTVAPGTLGERAAGTAVNWTGTVLVLLLLPMTATSNAAAQKLMGPEWKRWQRGLVWVVWAFTLGHVLLLHDQATATGLVMASLPLMALRAPRVRRRVKDWRQGGYADGRVWFYMCVLAVVFAAGLVILLTLEGEAVARALTLSPL